MNEPWQKFCSRALSIHSIIASASIRSSFSAHTWAAKVAAVALFASTAAMAQQAVQVWTPLGFQTFSATNFGVTQPAGTTFLTTGTTLTVPNGARWALICAEDFPVRYRDDGVTPTQTVGIPIVPTTSGGTLVQNNCITYSGSLTTQSTISPPTTPGAIQFTPTATGAVLDVTYYR